MKLARENAILQGGLAAVLLVAQVVHVAVDGAPGAAGPFAAAAGAELDGAPDVRRDAAGGADVPDHGLAVERLGEPAAAPAGSEPAGAGGQGARRRGRPAPPARPGPRGPSP